ncbi:MAG: MBL fold metallo-hydrolase RNA specificity domain-containing protein [Planctomycetota bacterium]|jgi:metallo-beta-lactamase family protein
MQIKLKFLGAAQNVTGSRHLLEANGVRVLIDCGLYQERQFRERNWDPFPTPPDSIDAVLLTHAHLDHCGLLPKLAREGFKGKIYCTAATAEIAKIILLDSAHLQEEDAEYKRKRHEREGRKGPYPEIPLYTTADAEACLPLFSPAKYREAIQLGDDVEATFYDAGHVLGSSIIRAKVRQNNQERIILFSGDMGRPDRPIVCDPTVFDEADYVLIESTYGDTVHEQTRDVKKMIGEVINSTKKAGGNIIIPSFALERSQEVLYYINELLLEDAIPHLMVFLDSPMATRITKVFQHHPELFDEEMTELVEQNESPFNFPGLKMVSTTKESKAINHIKGTVVVIAGSGMCTGGRVKHHLVNNITRPESTIMFVGYQAVGTLGRQIVDGEKQVRILGQKHKVKARIVRIRGFSAHADRDELFQWLTRLKKPPKKLFVVHGESENASSFGDYVREKTGWKVAIPAYQQEVVLD